MNQLSLRCTNTSGYRGVSFKKSKNKWVAALTFNGKRYFLGYFDSAAEAALAWNTKAYELHGEHAWLNEVIYEGKRI